MPISPLNPEHKHKQPPLTPDQAARQQANYQASQGERKQELAKEAQNYKTAFKTGGLPGIQLIAQEKRGTEPITPESLPPVRAVDGRTKEAKKAQAIRDYFIQQDKAQAIRDYFIQQDKAQAITDYFAQ